VAAPATSNHRAADTVEIATLADELVGRIWGHFQARAAELSLSVTDAKALLNLQSDQALPMRVLATRLHSNPSNVTVVVARLEARGLLERQGSGDRRIKGVRLTAAGAELRDRLKARLVDDHPAVVGLSAAEQRSLVAILRRLSP
jgi:DNA-binding MarR family transcriptional regulator